jgi:hypothetical protein
LPRYNQNVSHDNLDDKSADYAMIRNVLQCNELGMRYYTDVAGKPRYIQSPVERHWKCRDLKRFSLVSGQVPDYSGSGHYEDYDLPPEWGMELIIDEAVISYGPWADRQRVEIQNFFFPNSFRTVDITPEALPGQDRIHAALQIMVTFSSTVTIKIPTQEKSKVWQRNECSSLYKADLYRTAQDLYILGLDPRTGNTAIPSFKQLRAANRCVHLVG